MDLDRHTTLPTLPTGFSATATSPFSAALAWTASTDNIGVTGYDIFRNGALLTTVTPSKTYILPTYWFVTYCYTFAQRIYGATGKRVSGEKLTPYRHTAAHAVDVLHDYNPDVRFVNLVRDGRRGA